MSLSISKLGVDITSTRFWHGVCLVASAAAIASHNSNIFSFSDVGGVAHYGGTVGLLFVAAAGVWHVITQDKNAG